MTHPPSTKLRALQDRLRTMPYAEYLQTEYWLQRRLRALQDADFRCQVCNSEGPLDVHHRTYERRGCERPSDLVVLCRDDHRLFSRHRALAPPPLEGRSRPAAKTTEQPQALADVGYNLPKLRRSFPAAYKRWTRDEEVRVLMEFDIGCSIKSIAEGHGRQEGAIRARLVKLGRWQADTAS